MFTAAMSRFSIAGAWSYLALLLLGYGFAGWLLAAFQVAWFVWVGTLAMTLHLIRARSAAIALSSSWVAIVISIAAVTKAWAAVWDSRVPFQHAQLWAEGLLLIWLGAIGLVVLLAFADTAIQPFGLKQKRLGLYLTLAIWGALGIGKLLYQLLIH